MTVTMARIERLLWIGCPVLLFSVMFGRMAALVNNGMALVGIALVAAAFSRKRPSLHRWPLFATIIGWAVWSFAATRWSMFPAVSVHAWLDEVVYPLLSFWGFWLFGTRIERPERVALTVWVACALLATVSVACWGQLQPPTPETFPLRFYARVGHTSTLAVFAMALFCAFLVPKPNWRWLGVIGLALCILIGLATLNRFFWPAAAVTLLVGLYPLYRRHLLLAALAVVVVGVGAIGTLELSARLRFHDAPPPLTTSRDILIAGIQLYVPPGMTALGDTLSSDTRPRLWKFYEEEGSHRPWLGVGFGKPLPGMAYRSMMPPDLLSIEPQALTHAHNLFLNTWLQAGRIGLTLQTILLLSLAVAFWRLRRTEPWIAFAGIALVVGMVAKNAVDDFMWQTTILAFWSFAGVMLGYGERRAGVRRAQVGE
ncbi:O-antigen ligase family protein [Burkholderia multivorans]|uniref:O-antigen ligase family protein n=1 Tax=Burkholderia multivorans TaxID=87883 RepID=UPI001C2175D9|nr:O-antigen ligase family protein [Burkholderia multivorans]MBU9608170.1 O-antigen ligase family protein [Burkholderia multivorans]MBU9626744.1 O-antigen ligase family protein [Burkholderia multivorans]